MAARKARLQAEQELDLLQRDREDVGRQRKELADTLRGVTELAKKEKGKSRARRLHKPARPLNHIVDEPRAALDQADLDITDEAGHLAAQSIISGIAHQFGIAPNELWRQVMHEPEGMARDIEQPARR